ncbi:hypothetical protein JB92DRAFT_3110191 [Gautieria morchelliformis]|nr:hypothetical protein JB92DRAFT_3110191 [Gautieria morchelliformis]
MPSASQLSPPPPPNIVHGDNVLLDTATHDVHPLPVVAHSGPATPSAAPSASLAPMQYPARRKVLRMDAQDGPWSVSVAENPHDAKTYSIYIQTPTHHLTLTRTASEVVDLHGKLADAYPNVGIPPLPLNDVPTKRRSSFLHTLSRLANNSTRPPPTPRSSSQTLPTPAVSPSRERDDPFASPLSAPSAAATSLASYLTVISNHPSVRTSRPWRRFVRVRTDDLESVRVERAIKRVRSDLGMHLPAPATSDIINTLSDPHPLSDTESIPGDVATDNGDNGDGATVDRDSGVGGLQKHGIKEEEEDEDMLIMREDAKIAELVAGGDAAANITVPHVPELSSPVEAKDIVEEDTTTVEPSHMPPQQPVEPSHTPPQQPVEPSHTPPQQPVEPLHTPPQQPVEDALPTPAPSPPTPPAPSPPASPVRSAARIPRSASADPDKASRLSRVWTPEGEDTPATPKRKPKRISPKPKTKPTRKVVVDDFDMMRVLGKGCAGKVLLVRHRASSNLYALKAITKRHVLAHQELQHTLTEQAVLKRMAHEAKDPFVVKLWWSFHDKDNLFLVMDFHPGGDLATQLARWGRLGRDRARFYAAEIVEGVDGLHAAGVIYRDLKPENILIGSDGHIVLTDFGLSKEFPRRSASGVPLTTAPSTPKSGETGGADGFYSSTPGTPTPAPPHWMQPGADASGGSPSASWVSGAGGSKDVTSTFCGTAEYLAPEVIQGLPYSYEVDWWSFGTMLYEMLTGITPFWANNHSDMYVRVLQDELQFPDDKAMDQDTKSLIRGLLQRNPALRMSEPRIKRHPYFSMIDWSHVYYKRYIPPYIPPIDPSNASDTQNFDEAFLDMDPIIDNDPDPETQTDSERERSEREESDTSRSPMQRPVDDDGDVFDGYSFKGRHSVVLDDADDDGYDGHAEDEDEDDVETPTEPEEPAIAVSEHVADVTVVQEPPEAATVEKSIPADEVVEEIPAQAPTKVVAELVETVVPPVEPAKSPTPPPKTALKSTEPRPSKAVTIATPRAQPRRREKSGVPALDRHLSRVIDEDEDVGTVTERDDDDDWDFVETPGGEDRNGAKGTSLFARGVVDRYRLAVFRKASSTQSSSGQPRSFSGLSVDSDIGGNESAAVSPSPSEKRRGRNTGLSIGKSTRQFLRARSPPSTFSSGTRSTSRTTIASAQHAATVSGVSSGLLTPSPSMPSGASPATIISPHSLKSKDSTTSMGSPSGSSDGDRRSLSQSAADITAQGSPLSPSGDNNATENGKRPTRTSSGDEPVHKLKKMKKYKEGAEKVLSLFGSPRQERSQPSSSSQS